FRLGTGKKTVVERLVIDPALVQLPFGPLMPVEAQFDSPRRVAADFDKQRSEVLVVNVEVVVVDVDRFVAVELKLAIDLRAAERFRLLLRHADEDDLIPHSSLTAEIVGNVVFSLSVLELIDR